VGSKETATTTPAPAKTDGAAVSGNKTVTTKRDSASGTAAPASDG
jgi:hypothetical protein